MIGSDADPDADASLCSLASGGTSQFSHGAGVATVTRGYAPRLVNFPPPFTCESMAAMKIVSVRLLAVANILAIIYAICGGLNLCFIAATHASMATLPLGIIAPPFHLNFNLNMPFSANYIYDAFLCICLVLSMAATGWLSGLIIGALFNLAAKGMGGFRAARILNLAPDDAN